MNEDKTTKVVGMLNDEKFSKKHEQSRRVYDVEGIAPTMHTNGGGNLEPKIKVVGKLSNSQNAQVIETDGISICICSGGGGHDATIPKVVTKQVLRLERTEQEKARRHQQGDKGAKYRAKELQPRTDNCSNTLTTIQHDNLLQEKNETKADASTIITTPQYIRIRKLTERECFRLMGVEDTDIDTIQASGISKTQQYKMAGNSIVVDVLYHIFRQLLTDDKQLDQQLSMF